MKTREPREWVLYEDIGYERNTIQASDAAGNRCDPIDINERVHVREIFPDEETLRERVESAIHNWECDEQCDPCRNNRMILEELKKAIRHASGIAAEEKP